MCDTGDVVDVLSDPIGYPARKAAGALGIKIPNPGADIAKLALGLNDQKTPTLPDLAPPPGIPDLSDELVKRAASAQRLRQMMTQGVGLTGVMGLPTPTRIPGLGGA